MPDRAGGATFWPDRMNPRSGHRPGGGLGGSNWETLKIINETPQSAGGARRDNPS
jgi:hypothetical protein